MDYGSRHRRALFTITLFFYLTPLLVALDSCGHWFWHPSQLRGDWIIDQTLRWLGAVKTSCSLPPMTESGWVYKTARDWTEGHSVFRPAPLDGQKFFFLVGELSKSEKDLCTGRLYAASQSDADGVTVCAFFRSFCSWQVALKHYWTVEADARRDIQYCPLQ